MNNVLKPGQCIAGKYVIGRLLGSGGMGVVVAARHVELDAPRAIKVPLVCGEVPEHLAEQFRREAQIGAQIAGDHVVRIYDAGLLEGGAPYIVMEHLEGSDLEVTLRLGGRLPVGEAALYVMQACAGMERAHALGIVHRDLKPANLFLTARADGSPCVKVLDFGIARSRDVAAPSGKPSGKGSVEGSPAYMAPEQAIAGPVVDARADIWALGVILYELLIGRTPFSGASVGATLALVLNCEPTPAEALRTDLPAGIAAILSRCLRKNPTQRFQSVVELREALAPFASAGARNAHARIAHARIAQVPTLGGGAGEGQTQEHRAAVTTRRIAGGSGDVAAVHTTVVGREASHSRVVWAAWMTRAGELFQPGVDPLQTLAAAGLSALRRYVGDRVQRLRRDVVGEKAG
jgi:eukaryotic-like serine/threonine-protein kinase